MPTRALKTSLSRCASNDPRSRSTTSNTSLVSVLSRAYARPYRRCQGVTQDGCHGEESGDSRKPSDVLLAAGDPSSSIQKIRRITAAVHQACKVLDLIRDELERRVVCARQSRHANVTPGGLPGSLSTSDQRHRACGHAFQMRCCPCWLEQCPRRRPRSGFATTSIGKKQDAT